MHSFSWKPEDTAITPAGILAVLSIQTDALTPHQVLVTHFHGSPRLASEGTDFEHSDKTTLRQLVLLLLVAPSCLVLL